MESKVDKLDLRERTDSPLPHSCVIVLCGLPASGKSSYARAIVSSLHLLEEAINRLVIGEKYASPFLAAETISFDQELHNMVAANDNCFTPEIWHESRSLALGKAEEKLKSSSLAAKASETPTSTVLILDDNMNYRSMRAKVCQMCQRTGASLVQMAITSAMDTCITRNEAREGLEKVSKETLLRMPFDLPGSGSHWWDVHAILISNDISKDLSQLASDIPWDTLAKFFLDRLPTAPSSSASELSHQINEKSFLHQLDLACRKVVSEVLSTCASKLFAPQLSQFKQHFLQRIRLQMSSTVDFGLNTSLALLVEEAAQTFRGELFSFLQRLQQRLLV